MSSPQIAILTDSTCDIPPELLEEYHIHVIPQRVIWGEETYRDRIDISPEIFYRRLEKEAQHPTTTQPSPADFQSTYQEIFSGGAQTILTFTVSSAMSGTYRLARQTAEEMERPIRVIDSKGPTMSLGWQVLAAARAREQGGSVEEIIRQADLVRDSLNQIVYLNTLKYLHKGGRIGTAARWIGGMLNFKPLVRINHQSGEVEPAGRARTEHNGLDMLWDKFFQPFEPAKPTHIAVLHGSAPERAQALAERIRSEIQPQELILNITGPVLGVNTGPGALALCGYRQSGAESPGKGRF